MGLPLPSDLAGPISNVEFNDSKSGILDQDPRPVELLVSRHANAMKLGDATTPAGGRRTGLTVAIGLGGVVSGVRMDPRPSLLLTNRSVTITPNPRT